MIGVTGHFVSYTFIVVIIRDVVGVRGPNLAWLLAAYRCRGVLAVPLVARPLDRRPRGAILGCTAGLTVAFAAADAARLRRTAHPGDGADRHRRRSCCGAPPRPAVTPMLQSAAMRSGANDPDGASGLYVTAFQVGIMAGSLAGGLLYERSVAMMLTASASLVGIALIGMAANRQTFDVTEVTAASS